ncbi:uncharacterized [Tachysurus ichikawai]
MSGAQTALDRQPFCSVGAAGCEHVRADSEGLRPTLGLRTALTCSDGLHTSSQYQPAHPEARERVKLKIQPNLPPSMLLCDVAYDIAIDLTTIIFNNLLCPAFVNLTYTTTVHCY